MTDETLVTPQEAALAEKLKDVGIPLSFELSASPKNENQSLPVCAVWHQSAIPIEGEVYLLESLALTLLGSPLAKEKRELSVPGADTIIFRKDGEDKWRFRRSSWRVEEWSAVSGPLEKLTRELAPALPPVEKKERLELIRFLKNNSLSK